MHVLSVEERLSHSLAPSSSPTLSIIQRRISAKHTRTRTRTHAHTHTHTHTPYTAQ